MAPWIQNMSTDLEDQGKFIGHYIIRLMGDGSPVPIKPFDGDNE